MSGAPQNRRVTTFDIFVGNLPPEADQKKIGKVFSRFGEIHNIWLNSSSDGNKFGLVKFYCEEDSLKAIEETNGMLFEGGKPMMVKKSQKRGQRKEGDIEGATEKDMESGGGVPAFELNSAPPNKRDVEKLLVSFVETPIIMWGQKLSQENANELASVLEQLAVICPEAPKVTGKPENDKIYGAQYTEDGCWYRCTVRYTFNPERVKVQYIDFGNTEELNPVNLVELPRSLTILPPCAMKYVLHSLWCNNNQDANAIKYLKDLIEGQEVDAYTTARLSDHTGFFAEIYIDGTSVNEKMLESGYAFRKPGLEQRGLKGRGLGADGDMSSNKSSDSPVSTASKPKDEGQAQKHFGMKVQQSHSEMRNQSKSLNEPTNPNRDIAPSPVTTTKNRVSSPIKIRKAAPPKLQTAERSNKCHLLDPEKKPHSIKIKFLSSRTGQDCMKGGMMNQRDGPRKFESDKDEISNLRWKLKNLQTEFTSLSNKAQENNLSGQIKNLQILTNMVRKLRHQFPLEKETPIDIAVALVQSPDKIDINMAASLPEVISAINAYKSAQDEILKCSDKAILSDKIETRNTLRKDLFDKLSTTIEELNKVPLQDRGTQVKDVVSALTKHYDAFTKIPIPSLPSLDSLLPTFEEWKVKKKGDVVGARRLSDTMESSVNAAFTQLNSALSLNLEVEAAEMPDDVDVTLKNYAKALQQEIAVADTENSPDAVLIGSLTQVLLRDLQEENLCVEHLSNVQREFTSLKEQITPWLETAPTTDELQSVRSKLKTLKSKLRHKLADKVDAEENQDTEELEEIAKDLEDIRNKIHKALKEEDKLMSELSQLASAHFPELLNSESDTGFSTHLTYKGLVKLSHAPDHFKLTSVGSSSSGMFVSQFDGEPVFIKEYFLSSGNHLDKDEFLSHMALYTNASSPYLEPVSSVFFDKNSRHAYVQVKKQGELLSTLIETSALTKQQCQSILKSLCMALQALNLFNFVHGQIQPEFVVVDEEGNAKLLPPDFSLTDADRCRSRYTTSSGLEIISPEMKQSMLPVEPAHSVDIYCLGILALWMHHPTVQFLERKEGTVDFSTVPLDRNLGIFLMKLLCPNPMLRPTAEQCLRSEYLCQPVLVDPQPIRGQSPLISGSFGDSKDPSLGRNSASPASILSQNSSDGLVYTDSGAGVQMIANTRVPPPPITADSMISSTSGTGSGTSLNTSLPPSLQQQQQPASLSAQHHQLQQQQQYQLQQQLIQQQLQQQQQQQQQQQTQQHPLQAAPAQQNGSFEIGTFDPNAYEVVTSPQPVNANRPDEDDDTGAAAADLADASSEDDGTNEDEFKDAGQGGADGEIDDKEVATDEQ